jgi:hypothetical protein
VRARRSDSGCSVEQKQECAKDEPLFAKDEWVEWPFAWASSETAWANTLAWQQPGWRATFAKFDEPELEGQQVRAEARVLALEEENL